MVVPISFHVSPVSRFGLQDSTARCHFFLFEEAMWSTIFLLRFGSLKWERFIVSNLFRSLITDLAAWVGGRAGNQPAKEVMIGKWSEFSVVTGFHTESCER